MAARAILFDLDGTIWDSRPWFSELLCASSIFTQEKAMSRLCGGGNVVDLIYEAGISKARFLRACVESVSSLGLYPEVRSSLIELQRKGVRTGIVTNLARNIAAPVLNELGLSSLFEVSKYAAGKPRTGALVSALRELDIESPKLAVYVGDSPIDAQAALGAGMPFAWASYGYFPEEPSGTSVILREFAQIAFL